MPQSERIPFEGVLNCWNDDHDLPDLLLSVSRSGKTGRLQFSNPEGDKTLYFKDGKITFAESSSQDDGLGQYLLRTGKISLMDYMRAAKRVAPGKRLGELLVEEEVLDAAELAPVVVGQVRSILLGLFRRTETWYAFKEMETPPSESIAMSLPVAKIILEGVRFVESWRRISKGVGNLDSIYRSANVDAGMELEPAVRELLQMLAEPLSIEDICNRASVPDFEACRYLWALRSLGWIERVDPAEFAVTDSASPLDDAQPPSPPMTEPVAPPPSPPPIPERLIETQIAMDRPAPPEPAAEPPPAAPSPKPPPAIPEELLHTQMFVEPPSPSPPPAAPLPKSEPIPESLVQTQLSVKPPSAPPQPEPKPRAVPEELLHTQMFVEPPAAPAAEAPPAPPSPKSTGELMESILEGESPTPTEPPAAPATPPDRNQTQFFEGPSALAPPDAPVAPSGFEALAMDDGPGTPATPTPTTAPTPPAAGPAPGPADTPTLPSIEPPAPAPEMPTVEAEIAPAVPAPPKPPGMSAFGNEPMVPAPPPKASRSDKLDAKVDRFDKILDDD